MLHNHIQLWASLPRVQEIQEIPGQLGEFYIGTSPGILSVNEWPGLEATLGYNRLNCRDMKLYPLYNNYMYSSEASSALQHDNFHFETEPQQLD